MSASTATTTVNYYAVPTLDVGKIQSLAGSNGETLSYAYDGPTLLQTAWSGVVAAQVNHTYTSDLLIATESVVAGGAGSSVSYGYADPDGLLTSAGALTISLVPATGQLSGTTLGTSGQGVSDSYTYDTESFGSYGEVASYTATATVNSTATTIYAVTVSARDALGRITNKTETTYGGATHSYQYVYSSRGWLTDVYVDSAIGGTTPTRQYTYDAAGNRNPIANSTTPPNVDAQDRLLSGGTSGTPGYVSYEYAPNGELTSKTVTQSGGGTQTVSYVYDGLGNLLQVTLPAPTSGGSATTISYVIDGEGRRVAKLVNATLTQGFLYRNAINVAAVLSGSGSVVEQFIYGTRANVPDYLIYAGGNYRVVSDLVGSPRAVVNAATGAVVETMSYDEFGNETESVTAAAPSGYVPLPFGFAGGIYDAQTGLVHFGVREYDATIGRWTSKDPIRFGGGSNFYGYCSSDPINCVDFNGRQIPPQVEVILDEEGPIIAAEVQQVVETPQAQAFLQQVSSALQGGYVPEEFGSWTPTAPINFDVADRVIAQLSDPRLGDLTGMSQDQLQDLANNPSALKFFDNATQNVNIVQLVGDRLLRITLAGDDLNRIISVGPIQRNGLFNGIANGRFDVCGP